MDRTILFSALSDYVDTIAAKEPESFADVLQLLQYATFINQIKVADLSQLTLLDVLRLAAKIEVEHDKGLT